MLINQYQKNKVKLFEHNQKVYSSYSVFLFYLKIKNKKNKEELKIAVDNFIFALRNYIQSTPINKHIYKNFAISQIFTNLV